ncbi:unnamed protein product, partial [Chrysoparadoxa australica]
GRWSSLEVGKLEEMKVILAEELEREPRFPEVVGERRLLRFLRGHQHDVAGACQKWLKMRAWRRENGVDQIREDIVANGLYHPSQFPLGPDILAQYPLLVVNPSCFDYEGSLLAYECYDFSPREVIEVLGDLNLFIRFHIYCLELRELALEALSDEKEQRNLARRAERAAERAKRPIAAQAEEVDEGDEGVDRPWGEMERCCVIRDLQGFGLEHAGPAARSLLGKVMATSQANYPEQMKTCLLVNTPWVFSALFAAIQGMISPKTAAKIKVLDTVGLLGLVPLEHLPKALGGLCDPDQVQSEE